MPANGEPISLKLVLLRSSVAVLDEQVGHGCFVFSMRKEGNPEIPYVGRAWTHSLAVRQKLRKQLGSFLRSARGDLTFAQFEKKMGISGSTLHRIELGEQNVTLDTLEAIMDRLKVSVTDIFHPPKT